MPGGPGLAGFCRACSASRSWQRPDPRPPPPPPGRAWGREKRPGPLKPRACWAWRAGWPAPPGGGVWAVWGGGFLGQELPRRRCGGAAPAQPVDGAGHFAQVAGAGGQQQAVEPAGHVLQQRLVAHFRGGYLDRLAAQSIGQEVHAAVVESRAQKADAALPAVVECLGQPGVGQFQLARHLQLALACAGPFLVVGGRRLHGDLLLGFEALQLDHVEPGGDAFVDQAKQHVLLSIVVDADLADDDAALARLKAELLRYEVHALPQKRQKTTFPASGGAPRSCCHCRATALYAGGSTIL